MFLSRGFAATTVDAVAAEAGYTTGAVYSNFGGKADLFVAVLEHASEAELAAVRARLDEARTDEQRLDVFSAAIARNPEQWQARLAATIEFLAYSRRHPELHARMRDAQRTADVAVAELIEALCNALGVAPPGDIAEVTREVNALLSGLAIRSLFDDELDVGPAISRAINSLLTGDRSEIPSAKAEPEGAKGREKASVGR
jgi:AcrR family transcriptional regulator